MIDKLTPDGQNHGPVVVRHIQVVGQLSADKSS